MIFSTSFPASDVALADWSAAAAVAGTPHHAGKNPIKTVGLPGPPVKTGGEG